MRSASCSVAVKRRIRRIFCGRVETLENRAFSGVFNYYEESLDENVLSSCSRYFCTYGFGM